jgi:hypothetical protein
LEIFGDGSGSLRLLRLQRGEHLNRNFHTNPQADLSH